MTRLFKTAAFLVSLFISVSMQAQFRDGLSYGDLYDSENVAAMKEHGAVYFGAIGGCGALLSRCIKKAEIIAYEDLGAEAIRRLEVENFPVVVIIDSEGNNLYETGKRDYLATL